ncbi:efflux RND transporter periplasmic adaptor subunit [Longirhabdus pacifica]|uniref:efflux RND transporter periplasmic adaptor subunit n=1 Tax=Longirhabdus pacifica TaxID=2305227 RepID=UPI001008C237|nr:efflux RND transporter periplasmic adaptor subunit [Longirhabdus pacifica]
MSMKWQMENLSNHKKKKHKIHKVMLTGFMLSVILSGCALFPEEEDIEKLPDITASNVSQKPTYTVEEKTLEVPLSGAGEIMSKVSENVVFEEGGTIKEVYVKKDDIVEAGQLIAELDVETTEDDLRSKQIAFRETELDIKKMNRDGDTITEEAKERARINFEKEKLAILKLQEKIEAAKLYAPFSGTVINVRVEKGDNIGEYDKVAQLSDTSQLIVAVDFSSDEIDKIAIGMDAVVDITGYNEDLTGKVVQMPVEEEEEDDYYNRRNREETTEDFTLIQLDQLPEQPLSINTKLNAKVISKKIENAVVVPPSVLKTYGGREYVVVVEEDGTTREVDVEVGVRLSTEVEIIKGLEAGQKVEGR